MSRERNSPYEHRRRRDERQDEHEHEPDYEQDEEYEEYEEPRRRRTPQRQPYPRPTHSSSSQHRVPATRSPYPPSSRPSYTRRPSVEPRQRSVWPSLLMGCAIGVVLTVLALAVIAVTGIYSLQKGKLSIPVITPANRMISTEETQTIPLSNISQIIVCDVIGDVVVKADPTANNPTMTVTKKVQASSQAAADQQFQRMAVAIQPPQTLTGPLSCARLRASATPGNTTLQPTQTSTTSSAGTTAVENTSNTLTVNVTFPAGSSNASVDLTIIIPPGALPTTGPSAIVNIESAGNISVDGISGILNIKANTGNPQNSNDIKVTHAALANGSRLSTAGAITFNGYLAQAANPNKTAYYILEGEKQVDVTLPSDTNVTLEAYTVSGSISSQFVLQQNLLQKDKDMTSYHGPLNAAEGPPVNAQLTLHVGIGNVHINKAQAPTV